MYEFTEDDLKYNKRGALSPSQQKWLGGIARGTRSFSWRSAFISAGFTFLGLCIILALYLQNERSRAALFSDPVNLLVLAGVIPLVALILAAATFVNYRTATKLDNAVLSSVSGNVRFDRDYSSNSNLTTYFVIVGKKKFKFGDDMSHAFKEGGKYKFYYTKAGVYEFVMSYESLNQ